MGCELGYTKCTKVYIYLCKTKWYIVPLTTYAYLWPRTHRANKLRLLPPNVGMKNLSGSTNWQLNATSRPSNPTQPQGQELNDSTRLVSVVKFNLTYNSECPATNSLASKGPHNGRTAKIVAWTQSFRPGGGPRLEPLIILSVWNPLATQWPMAGSESGHVLVPVRRRV